MKSIAFNAAGTCWLLETAYCSASHDSTCCACPGPGQSRNADSGSLFFSRNGGFSVARSGSGWLGVARGGSGWLGVAGHGIIEPGVARRFFF